MDPQKIYDLLYARYGDLNWWPASSPYEVMVGAVLTQNTAWSNVEKAIANFSERLSPEFIMDISDAKLADIIRPSGFFNQKAVYLKELTRWYAHYSFSVENVRLHTMEHIRKELLSLKGIGKETADAILLYAFGYPSFVVDAYTKWLFERLPIDIPLNYDSIKAYFELKLPPSTYLYNNYHAMIVINAKAHCSKNPKCENCPLAGICRRGNCERGNAPFHATTK